MLDQAYIDNLQETLSRKDAKESLIAYAKDTYGIELKQLKRGFEVLAQELKTKLEKRAAEPMPENNDGLTIGDLIAADDILKGDQVDEDEVKPDAVLLIQGHDVVEPTVDVKHTEVVVKLPPVVEEVHITATVEEVAEIFTLKSELPDDFSPSLVLIGPAPGYTNIPYWVYDFIVENDDWKEKIHEFKHKNDHKMLYSLVYYINKNGNVKVRESRNSGFHIIK